jgi:hypothetical protein
MYVCAARGIRIRDVTLLEVQGCGRLGVYDLRHSCGGVNKGHWDICVAYGTWNDEKVYKRALCLYSKTDLTLCHCAFGADIITSAREGMDINPC